MVWTARARLTEVRVHAATAGDAKHGRQLLGRTRLERIVPARHCGRGEVPGAAAHGAERRHREEPARSHRLRRGLAPGQRSPRPARRRSRTGACASMGPATRSP